MCLIDSADPDTDSRPAPPDHESYSQSGQPNVDFMAIGDALMPECEVGFGRKANIRSSAQSTNFQP